MFPFLASSKQSTYFQKVGLNAIEAAETVHMLARALVEKPLDDSRTVEHLLVEIDVVDEVTELVSHDDCWILQKTRLDKMRARRKRVCTMAEE